jgi:outer membrane lipoprotein SlyB
MERVYFFLDSANKAKLLLPDIRKLGVDEERIHVIARNENLALDPLPEADLEVRTNLMSAARKGAAAGGSMGLLGGVLMASFPPAGIALGGGAILASTALGSALGAWMSSMIGISVTNENLQAFESRLDRGEVMVMVDIDAEQRPTFEQRVLAMSPGIVIESGVLDGEAHRESA